MRRAHDERTVTIESPERAEFPPLERGLVYLDSAATALRPRAVVAAVSEFLLAGGGPVHRSTHRRAAAATEVVEQARVDVARFVGAHADEVVFCRGTTEALNLLARGIAEGLGAGDEIVISEACHHASYVAFSLAASRAEATVRVVPVDARGEVSLDALESTLSHRTRVVSLPHVSNVTGALLDASRAAELVRGRGARLVLDGAQAFPHLAIDFAALGCDAYVFGAHKAYGPGGVGVLVARREWLAELPPLHGGGHMVTDVGPGRITLAAGPARHEAGTPNVEGIVGFDATLRFLRAARARGAFDREGALLEQLVARLSALPFVRVLGAPRARVAIVSFEVDQCHPHDVATLLDEDDVAVRAGRMCAHPLFAALGSRGALRASLAIYNDSADVDALVAAIVRAHEVLRGDP